MSMNCNRRGSGTLSLLLAMAIAQGAGTYSFTEVSGLTVELLATSAPVAQASSIEVGVEGDGVDGVLISLGQPSKMRGDFSRASVNALLVGGGGAADQVVLYQDGDDLLLQSLAPGDAGYLSRDTLSTLQGAGVYCLKRGIDHLAEAVKSSEAVTFQGRLDREAIDEPVLGYAYDMQMREAGSANGSGGDPGIACIGVQDGVMHSVMLLRVRNEDRVSGAGNGITFEGRAYTGSWEL